MTQLAGSHEVYAYLCEVKPGTELTSSGLAERLNLPITVTSSALSAARRLGCLEATRKLGNAIVSVVTENTREELKNLKPRVKPKAHKVNRKPGYVSPKLTLTNARPPTVDDKVRHLARKMLPFLEDDDLVGELKRRAGLA